MKLLITVFLLLTFQSIFSQEINKEMEQILWKFIHNKFVAPTDYGDTYIDTYPRDIAIKLEGNVSGEDSTCINELISQLKPLIPGIKIYYTPGAVCLVFNFTNKPLPVMMRTESRFGSIYFRRTFILTPKDVSPDLRRKIIYYSFYRSMVGFHPIEGAKIRIPGCVFDEDKPENITYSPYDDLILKKLYVKDFWKQYNDWLKKASFFTYYKRTNQYLWGMNFGIGGAILGFGIFTILLMKGVFRLRKRTWGEYNRQGLILLLVSTVCVYLRYLDDFYLNDYEINVIVNYVIRGIISVNLIFLIEKYLYSKNLPNGRRLFFIFLITLGVPWIVSMPGFENMSFSFRLNFLGVIFFGIAFTRTLYIYLNDQYSSMINQKDVELAKISELHKQAQLRSLQAKINPHFLYNALNSIASLATSDAKKTEQMALSLSDFFKYSINREQKQFNSLSEELNAIRTYLEIEKVRYAERLNFEIDCPTELLKVRIPQLLIQPLVENAIKHGLSKITGNGLIRILVYREENQLIIKVYDNGPAFPEGPLTGYGIQNTQERITLIYGGKASINWHNGNEKYIQINLPVVEN